MQHMRKIIAYSILAANTLALYSLPSAAHAAVTDKIKSGLDAAAKPSGYAEGASTDLNVIIGGLISQALGLLGLVLLGILIYAGFLWMTAQGDDTKVKKAKDMIFQGVIGLIIVVAAYAIADFVIGSLGNATTGDTGGSVTP
jgi:hypothetical protein